MVYQFEKKSQGKKQCLTNNSISKLTNLVKEVIVVVVVGDRDVLLKIAVLDGFDHHALGFGYDIIDVSSCPLPHGSGFALQPSSQINLLGQFVQDWKG